MIEQRCLILLLILSYSSAVIAMDGQSLPKIDFSNKTREELNQYALEHDVLKLTPRSKQSLEDRVKELGITKDTHDNIYTALASDGSRNVNYDDTNSFIFARLPYLIAQTKSTNSEQKGKQ